MAIRILIADGYGFSRAGIRYTLSTYQHQEILGEVTNSEMTINLVKELKPDILLFDINIFGLNVSDILSRLIKSNPSTRVIVLAAYDDRYFVLDILRAGIKGYISKEDDPEDLLKAISVVMDGKTWLSPKVSAMVINNLDGAKSGDKSLMLSAREIMILRLLCKGYRSKVIGSELGISKRTVDYYIGRIIRILGVKNRAEAVAKAIHLGLITWFDL